MRSIIARALLPALLVQLIVPSSLPADEKDDARPHPGKIRRFEYRAPNGFTIDVDARRAAAGGYTASAVLRSPSGEEMTFDLSPDVGAGPAVLIDDTILMRYRVGRYGRVQSLTVHDGERAVTSFHSARGHSADGAAYLHLVDRLSAHHSPEFMAELTTALEALRDDAFAPAGAKEWIACVLGVVGYVASVWGLIAGCTVLGVPTLGSSCLLAIFSHQVSTASAILSCFPD